MGKKWLGRIVQKKKDFFFNWEKLVCSVAESLRLGPGTDLFDFLAECIKDFCVKKRLVLGMCPCKRIAVYVSLGGVSIINKVLLWVCELKVLVYFL